MLLYCGFAGLSKWQPPHVLASQRSEPMRISGKSEREQKSGSAIKTFAQVC